LGEKARRREAEPIPKARACQQTHFAVQWKRGPLAGDPIEMDDIRIKEPDEKDDGTIALFLRRMLEDMANAGGHRVNPSETFWRNLPVEIRSPERKCLVAERGSELVGVVLAQVQPLDDVFEPIQSLHVSAIYVRPECRRQGIARRLLHRILRWGQAQGCRQADLNVLAGNKARHFYEKAGFEVFQHSMTRDL
jgi:ribosomal protein S18 acetylase RimI-like enzyme